VNRRVSKLSLAAVALFVLLGGPTPGSIGDCSESSNLADAVAHCRLKENWTCARRIARGDLVTDEEKAACTRAIDVTCRGAFWPVGCEPTQQQSDVCIQAMGDSSTLGGRGECFPDATSCGTPPIVQPGCASCDQPPQCNLCTGPSALTSGDAAAGDL
jgi:hypothetical protein